MQIHRVRGKNLREALERARTIHGEEALVLTHESTPSGEVMVAVGDGRPSPEATTPEAEIPAQPVPLEPPALEKGLADVMRRLGASGTSGAWMGKIGDRVRASGARGTYAIDVAAEALAQAIPIAQPLKADGSTYVMAFVGREGAGKTTTAVKLAIRLVKARRRLALLTLGSHGSDTARSFSSYAKLLQVPCSELQDPAQLELWFAGAARHDAVLMDLEGRDQRDVRWAQDIAGMVERSPLASKLVTYLVLPADSSAEELRETVRAYRDTNPSGCVITRLDRTRMPVLALEVAADAGLPLAFLSDGPEVATHLRRPTRDMVGDLFLRGRLA